MSGETNADQAGEDDDLLTALDGLSQLTMTTLALPDLLEHVAAFAVDAIPGADGAGVTLLHTARPDTIVASAQFVREVDAIQYSVDEGPCITAAATRETVRSGSLSRESRWPRFSPRVGELGIQSALSLPLITAAGVIGAMNVYAYAEEAFDDRAAVLGEMFATPAAVSVQNANALSAAVHLTQQLERALSNRAVIDQAIGIIISRSGVSPTDAFNRLRTISQNENHKLTDVAQRLVEEAAARARARRAGP